MILSVQYRRRSASALLLARESRGGIKALLLDVANMWLTLATSAERRENPGLEKPGPLEKAPSSTGA